MSFAAAFRQHVQPVIQVMIEAQAIEVAWERMDFEDVLLHAQREADKRGLGHLPPDLQYDFEDWAACLLLAEIDKHIPAVMAYWNSRQRILDEAEEYEEQFQDYLDGKELASNVLTGALGG